jgi:4-amino-4-deoxy-L-arabinose transferase-like glycosyltransferase
MIWNRRYIHILAILLSVIICALISFQGKRFITERGVRWSDDRENVSMAYNLYKYGVLSISSENTSPPQPACHREPIVPFATALFMRLHPGFQPAWTLEDLLQAGTPLKILKQINLVWVFLCLTGAWWTIRLIGGNMIVSTLAVLLIFCFSFFYSTLDIIMSEIPAAALLVWSGLFLVLVYQKKSLLLGISAGVVFGLLVLTKAVLYYVFFPVPLILFASLAFKGASRKQCLLLPVLLLLGFGLVVYPYMFRNYHHFGQFKITDRGGRVLLIRAIKNEMNCLEAKGAFYHWAPQGYQPALGRLLGFSEQDLMKGGSLQRLNRHMFVKDSDFEETDTKAAAEGRPEEAISFLFIARAERFKANRMFKDQGATYPVQEADRYLQDKAMTMIKEHPFRHILLTPLFLWRGVGEIHSGNPWLPELLQNGVFRATAHLIMFLCLFLLPVIAIYRRIFEGFLFSLPAIGMLLFFGLFSHNILRYPIPAYPIMILSVCVLVHWSLCDLYTMMRRRLKRVPAISES